MRLGRLAILGALLAAPPAHAIDPFEIQVYDATANRRGQVGIELHSNYVVSGVAPHPNEPGIEKQAHLTLEPSYGVTDAIELGGYLQFAHTPDGGLQYGGAKLRCKLVTAPGWDDRLRLGLNLELSWLPVAFDRSRYGGELRPIIAWESERALFALNPIVDFSFARPDASAGASFEPAAMAKLKLGPVAIGVEYYSALGTTTGFPALAGQQHYLFEAVDLLGISRFELNAALGQGLTSASNGLVGKLILGWTFGGPD